MIGMGENRWSTVKVDLNLKRKRKKIDYDESLSSSTFFGILISSSTTFFEAWKLPFESYKVGRFEGSVKFGTWAIFIWKIDRGITKIISLGKIERSEEDICSVNTKRVEVRFSDEITHDRIKNHTIFTIFKGKLHGSGWTIVRNLRTGQIADKFVSIGRFANDQCDRTFNRGKKDKLFNRRNLQTFH